MLQILILRQGVSPHCHPMHCILMYIMLIIVTIAENDRNFTIILKKTKNTILIMGYKLNLMQQGMVFIDC